MNVRLISVTQPCPSDTGPKTAEELIVHIARVSNPANQNNFETSARLLGYCIRKGHWSIFESVSMTVEIETSRAIGTQILRHRSFTFQEFSQRYSSSDKLWEGYYGKTNDDFFEKVQLREKGSTNRQGSLDRQHADAMELNAKVREQLASCFSLYASLLRDGVALECARMVLPLCTSTRIYMTGSVRSWIHYLAQRLAEGTQLEHREVATRVASIFKAQFPLVGEACRTEVIPAHTTL